MRILLSPWSVLSKSSASSLRRFVWNLVMAAPFLYNTCQRRAHEGQPNLFPPLFLGARGHGVGNRGGNSLPRTQGPAGKLFRGAVPSTLRDLPEAHPDGDRADYLHDGVGRHRAPGRFEKG